MQNDVTAVGKAKATAQVLDKSTGIQATGSRGRSEVTSRGGPNQITDVGMASRVTDRGMANNARSVNQNDLDSFHAEYSFKLSPQLDDAQRYEILEMLHCYKSVFARDMMEIQLCKCEPLKLELHSNCKMFKRQYHLSEPDKVEME